jgi:hypothetical protein
LVNGKVYFILQVLETLDLDLVAVTEVDHECLFLGADICFW